MLKNKNFKFSKIKQTLELTKTNMSLIKNSFLLVAFIATVYGQFTLGPFQVKFGIPLRLGGNSAYSNVNKLTSTMINIQNTIRSKYFKNNNSVL